MSLERRIALFTSLVILGLLACVCALVSFTIREAEKRRLAHEVHAARELYSELERERFSALEAGTKLLADLPQLRAVISTRDAATITDALEGFRAMVRGDHLGAVDLDAGAVYGLEKAAALALAKRQAEAGTPVHGYVSAEGGGLRQAVAVPVALGGRVVLIAEYAFGRAGLDRLEAMTRAKFVIGDAPPGEFMRETVDLTGPAGEKVARLEVLRPMAEGMQVATRLQAYLIAVSVVFCFAGAAVSFLVARSISRPIRELAAAFKRKSESETFLREGADSGAESDADVRELVGGFRDWIARAAQERDRSGDAHAERVRELEDRLGELKNDNERLARVHEKLVRMLSTGGPGRGSGVRLPGKFARLGPAFPHWLMGASALSMGAWLVTLEPLVGRTIIDEALTRKDPRMFLTLLATMGVLALLAFFFENIGNFFLMVCSERVRISIEAEAARDLLAGTGSGRIEDARQSAGALTILPAKVLAAIVQFAWTGILLLMLKAPVGVAAICGAVALAFLSRRHSARISRAHSRLLAREGAVFGAIGELAGARALIRGFHLVSERLTRFRGVQERASDSTGSLFFWEARHRFEETTWGSVFGLAVAAGTGVAVLQGRLTIGEYIAIQIYVGRIHAPVRALLEAQREAWKAIPRLRASRVIGESHPNDAPALPKGSSDLLVVEVRQLRVELRSGSRTLLAGHAEEGLDEILAWVDGTRSPPVGRILAKGRPLASLTEQDRRRWSATIHAEPLILEGATILENLCLGGRSPDPALLEAVGLGELETRLQKTSPIELRHRVQVARALSARPEILLVEDFAAALDGALADQLLGAIRTHARTVLAAGRRETLLAIADDVIWVENGKSVERVPVERFLSGPRAVELSAGGAVQEAIRSVGALSHARRWAQRHSVQLMSFEVDLFGDREAIDRSLLKVAKNISGRIRTADLVVPAGRSRIRCVFFNGLGGRALPEAALERKLWGAVAASLDGERGIYFEVRREEELHAKEKAVA